MSRFFNILFWFAVAVTLFLTLRPIVVLVPGTDKTHHVITFGVLMLLACAAYPQARIIAIGLALSGFGAAIEFAQPFFRRSNDMLDWVADSIGIMLALLIVWAVRQLWPRRQQGA